MGMFSKQLMKSMDDHFIPEVANSLPLREDHSSKVDEDTTTANFPDVGLPIGGKIFRPLSDVLDDELMMWLQALVNDTV